MHTSQALSSADFQITLDGHPAALADVLPGLDEHDRLGIVVGEDWGAAGASTVILAAVTAFYDRLRETDAEFFAYPDHFAFHLGADRGSLRKLDVFPAHKEVVVPAPAHPEELLRTINDRAITRLLVPEARRPERESTAAPDTLHSARRRIRTALAYSPSGRVTHADVSITGSAQGEAFVAAMLEQAGDGVENRRARLCHGDGRPRESFRRLTVDEALRLLEPDAE